MGDAIVTVKQKLNPLLPSCQYGSTFFAGDSSTYQMLFE
ncbi:hypothetical protein CCACVL1_16070, partial [Corchorus capsularis]